MTKAAVCSASSHGGSDIWLCEEAVAQPNWRHSHTVQMLVKPMAKCDILYDMPEVHFDQGWP